MQAAVGVVDSIIAEASFKTTPSTATRLNMAVASTCAMGLLLIALSGQTPPLPASSFMIVAPLFIAASKIGQTAVREIYH